MPEHAAVDTSNFNEVIPQALQQTLYTKFSNVQKAKSFISATLPLTEVYIYLGAAGKSTCNSWNGFHSLLNQLSKIIKGPPGNTAHKATENPWKSKNVTLLA